MGQSGSCPRHQPIRKRHQWSNRKYGAGKFRFTNAKNFSKNYPEFGYVPSKTFTNPALGQKKSVKNTGFKGTK
jgi:hypothetical protein